MTIKSKIGAIGTVSAAVLLSGFFATTANAAVVLVSTDTVLDAPILLAANLLDPTSTTGTVRIDYQGNDLDNVIPNSRSPYDGTGAFNVTNAYYHSVSTNSTATYTFGVVQTSFAFMWGSPDTYNTLNFFLNGADVGSFTGALVVPPGSFGAGFVDVVFNGHFDEVVFGSIGKDAFEFTNVASTPVPLPAAAWLLLSGLAGLGFIGRRKAK